MKWIYGKQDWKTLERGQENCFLMTNYLGGYSSLTMLGSASRNDHALLMACTQAPNHRYNLLHRLAERLEVGEEGYWLSTQEFAPEDSRTDGLASGRPPERGGQPARENEGRQTDGPASGRPPEKGGQPVRENAGRQTDGPASGRPPEKGGQPVREDAGRQTDGPASCREEGFRYLSSFLYEDTPVWRFQGKGVEIRKELGMKRGANTVALRYEITNRSKAVCRLTLTPFFQFTRKGEDLALGQEILFDAREKKVASRGLSLYLRTNGEVRKIPDQTEHYYYSYDACDGRRATGHARANHRISLAAEPGGTRVLEVIYEMEPSGDTASGILDAVKEYRRGLVRQAGFRSEVASMLAKSADQFIARRESTGGETVLAGFPFFEDWGRDTMVALPGLAISTRRYGSAREILRTFAAHEEGGLMPNLFPEGKNEPVYNTADAALLFINCVYLYYEATGDGAFVREMYPVMERIVEGYAWGTEYGIHMEEDGLIAAGEGLWQVTWMDVRFQDYLPTPRHGKPVEINAYWYNALRILEKFERLLSSGEAPGSTAERAGAVPGGAGSGSSGLAGGCAGGRKARISLAGADPGGADMALDYGALAERVRVSFREQFWMEEQGCLKDLVSGTKADVQIRCNQIWAVSLPFTMLEPEKERRVVDTVFEKLYTPCGLRTLEEADPEFHGFYGGSNFDRDMAYHQGTVWVFPLGAYYLSYLKVHGCSAQAKATVEGQLEALESALREGCIGQLPEIYDGGSPSSSKGCFAQAWSVGELLRVYRALEK